VTALDTAPTVADRPRLRRVLLHPAVAVIALAGALVRVWILLSPHGTMNADEAYTGLQAIDITRGHMAIVIGGAAYTGTLDTYALGPILRLTGQHVVTLKLMSPVLWAAAAVIVIGGARRWTTDRTALLAGALTWLTPGALAILSTRGYVAYALGFALVAATLWMGAVMVDHETPTLAECVAFGGLAGLAFYTHPMFSAVVGPVAVVVGLRHRRRLRETWLPTAAAALAVNLPFLLWNAKNSWPSLDQPPTPESTYTGRLRGFFVGLLPRDLGLRRIADGDWVLGRPVAALVVVAVLLIAAYGAFVLVRADPWRGAVLAAPLVFSWLLMAALSNLSYVDDGRYGIIVFPVLVLCFVAGLAPVLRLLPTSAWMLGAAIWLGVCTVPFLHKEAGTDLGDPNRQTQALIDVIEDEGFDRVAGYYWAVLPIEFQSGSRIRTAIAGNPYTIRLPHSQRLVDATNPDSLAYVFLPGPIDPSWVKLPIEQYRQVPVAGYVLYFPT
jgi:hypothetical protein